MVMIPTSLSPLSTGRALILLSWMRRAAFSMVISGRGRDDLLGHDISHRQLLEHIGEFVDAQGGGGRSPGLPQVSVRHDPQQVSPAVRDRELRNLAGVHQFPRLENGRLRGYR